MALLYKKPYFTHSPYLTHPHWPIVHGFFGRSHGLDCDQHAALKEENGPTASDRIAKISDICAASLAALPVFSKPILARQDHTSRVLILPKDLESIHAPADALVTKGLDHTLGIFTADCAPILLYDPAAGLIGAVHAGWKGAVDGVIENSIQAMYALGATSATLQAMIGPMIQQDTYAVSPDFTDMLRASTPWNISETLIFCDNQWFFDFPHYIHKRLAPLVSSIHDTKINTFGGNFFSHRYALSQEKIQLKSHSDDIQEHSTTKRIHHGRNIAWISLKIT